MTYTRRLFVALPLASSALELIEALATQLRERAARAHVRVRWTTSEQRHVTMRFLGSVDPELAESLQRDLPRALEGLLAIDTELTAVGVFGGVSRARVLHLAMRAPLTLSALVGKLDEALAGAGFEKETRPFHPHVTLGRFKVPTNAADLLAESSGLPIHLHLTAVSLYESKLGRDGARYVELARMPLRNPT